jgi:acetolactate synthase-1/2/3 large subunit
MSDQGTMNGAEWLARALAGTGMSHVFFVESVMRRTLLHLGDLGVKPILAHSEKAAAYMADGYARVNGRPGVCMAPPTLHRGCRIPGSGAARSSR